MKIFLTAHNVPTIFWPDFASCHYSKDVLKWYADNKVNFVPKMFNPSNTPELRSIEKYWAIMKQHLFTHLNYFADLSKRIAENPTAEISVKQIAETR